MIKVKTNKLNEILLNDDFLQLLLLLPLNKFHTWLTLKRHMLSESTYVMLAIKHFWKLILFSQTAWIIQNISCFGIARLDCKIIWSGTEYCLEILEKLKIHCFLNLPTNNCSVTYFLIERFLRHRFASATSKVKLGLYFVDRKSK